MTEREESPVAADSATLEDVPNYSHCQFVIVKFFFKLFLHDVEPSGALKDLVIRLNDNGNVGMMTLDGSSIASPHPGAGYHDSSAFPCTD
ncbi:hypothetical protein llap_12487 [Limosa lapponica baueri]|uniref:Uncharacterized protein n=1 Tax=Limosa lapponica baueri TaxID=1758121 RepID=A0A2I0TTU1_LIMLA|nr:hypothetical protein llap_12487 [Limosa lapponica baueri]